MKTLKLALGAALGLLVLANSAQATDVGVSINIGQPGFYGQINIGNAPSPRLIFAQPVLIDRGRGDSRPVYLRVPPGHEKNWSKHCKHYQACGQPVYFVRDDWYEKDYVPHYKSQHGQGHGDQGQGKGKGKEKNQGKGKGHDKD